MKRVAGCFDTAESDRVAGRANLPFAAIAEQVVDTILVRAEERTAALTALDRPGFGGIMGTGWALRVWQGGDCLRVKVGAVKIAGTLPNISRHIEKTAAERKKLRPFLSLSRA